MPELRNKVAMHALIARYESLPPHLRLVLAIGPVVLANAAYCLAYRYYAGHPATLAEAFAWGLINLAPWIAVVETGRHMRSPLALVAVIGAGLAVSLALEALIVGRLPDAFDLVRRLPGVLAAAIALAGLRLASTRFGFGSARKQPVDVRAIDLAGVAWVRSAGNYVELHVPGAPPRLVRSTLADCIAREGSRLVRIHRSHAVDRGSIDRVERAHVRLADGKRLPIGNSYRNRLADCV